MAKKKSVKKVKHQSFKVTPPKPAYGKMLFYLFVAGFIGFTIGLYLGDQVVTALATYTP